MKSISWLTFRRFGPQTANLAVAQIDSMHFAFLALRVKRVVIGWIEQDVKSVAAGKRRPIAIANLFLALHAARPDPVLVVLKPASDAEIRLRVVQRDSIIFSRGNSVEVLPVLAAGETLINAAVSSEQKPLANGRLRRLVFVFRLGRFDRAAAVPG